MLFRSAIKDEIKLGIIKFSQEKLELDKGDSITLTVKGYFSNGEIVDITDSVEWSAGAPGIIEFGTEKGQIKGLKPGKTTVIVEQDGITAQLEVMVIGLTGLEIQELPAEIYVGQKYQLKAIGAFNDGSTKDLTGQVLWRVEPTEFATIENASASKGMLKPTEAGEMDIIAFFDEVEEIKTTTVVDMTLAASLSVAGDSVGPVELAKNGSATIDWDVSNATSCILKRGIEEISTDAAGSITLAFAAGATISLECKNMFDESLAKSIEVEVFGAPSVSLAVGGVDTTPIKLRQGTSKSISWSSINAASCVIKLNDQTISSQNSGTKTQAFSADATIIIECMNEIGVKASKTIGVDTIEDPSVTLTLNGKGSSPQNVTISANQNLAWSSKYASSCTLKDDGSTIKSSRSGTMSREFTANTVLTFECRNSLGIKKSKSISITVSALDPVIKKFVVGGVGTSPVKLNVGDSRYITWNTANASSCFVKDGGSKISTAKLGSIKRTFNLTRNVYIECQNSAGKKVSKTLQVLTNMVGNIENKVSGFYYNPNWGEMVIRVEGTKFRATYNYQKGTVKGTYNPTTGYVTAWWCEVWDSKRGGYKADGQAQFIFIKNHSTGKIRLDGKWRYKTSGTWKQDWDLDLITSPNSTQKKIKSTLDKRFSQSGVFCGSY